MRDDQTGAAAATQVIVDLLFDFGIERARGFVQDENARFYSEGSRDFQALALSAAEVSPAFCDRGVKAP